MQRRGIGRQTAVTALLFPLHRLTPDQGFGLGGFLRLRVNFRGRLQLLPKLLGGGTDADDGLTVGAVLPLRLFQRRYHSALLRLPLGKGLAGFLFGTVGQGLGKIVYLLPQGGQGGFVGGNAVFQGAVLGGLHPEGLLLTGQGRFQLLFPFQLLSHCPEGRFQLRKLLPQNRGQGLCLLCQFFPLLFQSAEGGKPPGGLIQHRFCPGPVLPGFFQGIPGFFQCIKQLLCPALAALRLLLGLLTAAIGEQGCLFPYLPGQALPLGVSGAEGRLQLGDFPGQGGQLLLQRREPDFQLLFMPQAFIQRIELAVHVLKVFLGPLPQLGQLGPKGRFLLGKSQLPGTGEKLTEKRLLLGLPGGADLADPPHPLLGLVALLPGLVQLGLGGGVFRFAGGAGMVQRPADPAGHAVL